MNRADATTAPDLVGAISPRLFALWEAWKNQDFAAHDAILTEDYTAIFPDGTLQETKPTAQQIAAAPISSYTLTGLRAVPIEHNSALVSYIAEVDAPSGALSIRVRFAVGEVWIRRDGVWKCRFYQGTLMK